MQLHEKDILFDELPATTLLRENGPDESADTQAKLPCTWATRSGPDNKSNGVKPISTRSTIISFYDTSS
jgi:hypothetical protein